MESSVSLVPEDWEFFWSDEMQQLEGGWRNDSGRRVFVHWLSVKRAWHDQTLRDLSALVAYKCTKKNIYSLVYNTVSVTSVTGTQYRGNIYKLIAFVSRGLKNFTKSDLTDLLHLLHVTYKNCDWKLQDRRCYFYCIFKLSTITNNFNDFELKMKSKA